MRQRFAFRRVGVTHALFSPGWVHAFARHLHNLEQQNAELRQRLAIEARHRLDQQVERAVPNYREIDQDPRWHQWLLSSDPLSGRQRQQLLNDAIASGATNRLFHSSGSSYERKASRARLLRQPMAVEPSRGNLGGFCVWPECAKKRPLGEGRPADVLALGYEVGRKSESNLKTVGITRSSARRGIRLRSWTSLRRA